MGTGEANGISFTAHNHHPDSAPGSVSEPTPAPTALPPPTPSSRKVNRSCLECTRRKVKCDGRQPCSSCVYYRTPDACGYRQRSKRNAVSRSTYEKASEQIRHQADILETLFPGASLDDLAGKSHEELLRMLSQLSLPHQPYTTHRPHHDPGPATFEPQVSSNGEAEDSAAVSENGDAQAERRWDETMEHRASIASDDVNALGLTQDHHVRSYLGMTSMSAVIRAIFRLCPAAKEYTVQCSKSWEPIPTHNLPSISLLERDPALDRLKEQRCIDFYFDHFHMITPLLDEQEFRKEYMAGTRTDSSWRGLLYMVFVLGSIASGSEHFHEHYYRQARSFVNLDSLGAGNLESLHALLLLGGFYLHYRNSPNMAYGVLGAAHRLAIALGLHREPRHRSNSLDPAARELYHKRIEMRRRTWWSLFCLDTWGAMTQGRPTCGRWDGTTMDTRLPTPSSSDDYCVMSLLASSKFCLICVRMQHRVARFGRLTTKEVFEFDAEFIGWYDDLDPTMKEPSQSPRRFHIAREFMRTRYLNARMLLTRSSFLYIAHGHRKHIMELAPEHQQLLDTCCTVASDTIDSIALYWTPNRVHVWNAGWYLFQACMTPLLAIAVDRNMQTSAIDRVAAWRASLAKALETFAEMRSWMRTTDRSPDILSALYRALTSDYDKAMSTPSVTSQGMDLLGLYDDQLGEVDWSTFLGGEHMIPFQGIFPPP
jgi:hypothetical protein